MRPFKRWVVVLRNEHSCTIPLASTRRKLNENGRVKRLELRRNLSREEVKSIIVRSFPTLRMDTVTFLKCGSGNTLHKVDVKGGYPNGALTIASKESLYLVEEVVRPVFCVASLYS